jgi:hypothetical protein
MKKVLLAVLFISLGGMAMAQDINYRQTIRGTVVDEQSGNVLSNITVTIEGMPTISSITDSTGAFKLLRVPIVRQTIIASNIAYEMAIIQHIEVTSSKEVVIEIKLKEKIKKLDEVIVNSGRPKNRALNDAALVSARQLSVDEAFRYSGTRNDPSRMAQNFAGVS